MIVVKKIKNSKSSLKSRINAAFIKETRLLRMLRHDNILGGVGFYVKDDELCIVTDYGVILHHPPRVPLTAAFSFKPLFYSL